MKIQLLMKGKSKTGKAQFYRTITQREFGQILQLVSCYDGRRSWKEKPPKEPA